jgi:RHS repeat-associated protein
VGRSRLALWRAATTLGLCTAVTLSSSAAAYAGVETTTGQAGGICAGAVLGGPPAPSTSDAWVAIPNGASSPGTVQPFNSGDDLPVGPPVTVGDNPTALAVDLSQSQVIVADSGDTTATAVNTASEATTTINNLPGGNKSDVAIDLPRKLALVLDQGAAEVSVIDVTNDSLVGNIPLANVSSGNALAIVVSPDGNYFYVSDPGDTGRIEVYQYDSSAQGDFSLLQDYVNWNFFPPRDLEIGPGGDTLYSSAPDPSDYGSTHAYVLEYPLSSGKIQSPSPIDITAGGPGPIALSPSADTVYVGLRNAADSSFGNLAVLKTNPSNPNEQDYTLDVHVGWVRTNDDGTLLDMTGTSSTGSPKVETWSPASQQSVNTYTLANPASAIAPSPMDYLRYWAYVANYASNNISVVDTVSQTTIATIGVGSGPVAVAASPDGAWVYVADKGDGSIYVISTALIESSVSPVVDTYTLPPGAKPTAIAVDPDGSDVLIADSSTGAVYQLSQNASPFQSGISWTLGTTPIYLDNTQTADGSIGPDSIAFTPGGDYAYVADAGDNSITVLTHVLTRTVSGYSFNRDETGIYATDPTAVAVSPDGNYVYMTDGTDSQVMQLPISGSGATDPGWLGSSSDTLSLASGSDPLSLSASPAAHTGADGTADEQLYVGLNTGGAAIVNIAGGRMSVSTTVYNGNPVPGIAATPDGSGFVFADDLGCGEGYTHLVTSSGSEGAGAIGVGNGPSAVAMSPDFAAPGQQSLFQPSDVRGGGANPSVAASPGLQDVSGGVDTASGAYSFGITEFDLPSLGYPLNLTLTYDSNADTSAPPAGDPEPFGRGWSFSLGMSLTMTPSPTAAYQGGAKQCQVTWNQENGSTVVFSEDQSSGSCSASDAYLSPPQAQASLAYVNTCSDPNITGPCFSTTRDGGLRYYFTQNPDDPNQYLLADIINRAGDDVQLKYNGNHLASVTGAVLPAYPSYHGRELDFTWTGNEVTKVTVASRDGDAGGSLPCADFSYNGTPQLTEIENEPACGSTSSAPTAYYLFGYDSSLLLENWWAPDNASGGSGVANEDTVISYVTSFGPAAVTQLTEPQVGGVKPTWTFDYESWQAWDETGSVVVDDPAQSGGQTGGDVTLDRYVDGALVDQVQGYGPDDAGGTTAISLTMRDPQTKLPAETIDPLGRVTSTTFDSQGNALEVTDAAGNTTSYQYDFRNQVTYERDPLGRVTTWNYDNATSALLSETNPDGATTTWSYDTANDAELPISMTRPGAVTDTAGDVSAGTTDYSYDPWGDLAQTKAPDYGGGSAYSDYSYIASTGFQCGSVPPNAQDSSVLQPSCLNISNDAAWASSADQFDFYGHPLDKILAQATQSGAGTPYTGDAATQSCGSDTGSSAIYGWCYVYDADGNLTRSTNPEGHATGYAYDALDRLVSVTQPSYSDNGTMTSPKTTYGYDLDGHKVTEVTPDGDVSGANPADFTTTYYYDNLGDVTKETQPAPGKTNSTSIVTTTSSYDADGEVLTTTSPPTVTDTAGVETTYSYDDLGDVLSKSVAPAGANAVQTTTYSYDADRELTSTVAPDGNVSGGNPAAYTTSYCYDGEGRRVATTDPKGTTYQYYDPDGNLYATVGGDANTGNGSSCSARPMSPVSAYRTFYAHNTADELTSVTDADGNVTSYRYDPDGNLTRTSLPGGAYDTALFDTMDRPYDVGQFDQSGTETLDTTRYYNGDGQLETMADTPNGLSTTTTSYNYYDTAWLKSVSRTGAEVYSLGYGYDPSGNVTTLTYPDGSTTAYTYDGQGEVDTATFNSTNAAYSVPNLQFTYSYDSAGNVTKLASGAPTGFKAVATSYSYDNVVNLTAVSLNTSPSTLKFAYSGYDADGQVGKEVVTGPDSVGGTTYYGYNAAQELTQQGTSSPPPAYYGYDASGFEVRRQPSDTQSFDQAGELTASSGTAVSYAYNAAGARTTSTGQPTSTGYCPGGLSAGSCPYSSVDSSYSWTPGLELSAASVTGVAGSTNTTVYSDSYTYDGNGVRESTTNAASQTTSYVYDGSSTTPRLLTDGSFDYVYGAGVVPIAQVNLTTGEVDTLVGDGLGNVRAVVALNGANAATLVNYTAYDAYGKPSSAGGLTTPQTAVNANFVGSTPFGFGGGYTDETGLVYLIHRYYDPETGQFLSVDPLVAATQQAYAYAANDPLDGTDPSGLWRYGPQGQVCNGSGQCNTGAVNENTGGTPAPTYEQAGYGFNAPSGWGAGAVAAAQQSAIAGFLEAMNEARQKQLQQEAVWAQEANLAIQREVQARQGCSGFWGCVWHHVSDAAGDVGHGVVSASSAVGRYVKAHGVAITLIVAGVALAAASGGTGFLLLEVAADAASAASEAGALEELDFAVTSASHGFFVVAPIVGSTLAGLGSFAGGIYLLAR